MNDSPTPQKLRWFQFGLRDILWLTIAFALLLGWWNDHKRLSTAAEKSAKDAADRGAEVDQLQGDVVAVRDQFQHALQILSQTSQPQTFPPGLAVYEPGVIGLVSATHQDEHTVEINL